MFGVNIIVIYETIYIERVLKNLNKHKNEKKSRSSMFSHAKPQNSRIGGKKSQKQSAHFVLSHISQAANIHNDNSKTKRKWEFITPSSLLNRKQNIAVKLYKRNVQKETV